MTPLLQHQLILDRRKAVLATRLNMHAESAAAAADELNRLLPLWTFNHPVMLALDGCKLDKQLLDWKVPEHLMLEVPAVELDGADFKLMRSDLVHKIALCTRGMSNHQHPPPRYVLTDFADCPAATLNERQLATGLADMEGFDGAMAAGYGGACGNFFHQPARAPSTQVNPSHANIIHLLNLVRNNAEVKDIEAAFKQDVSLAFKFLRYINSAGFGLMSEIGSFRQAVTVIGYNKLNRWLSLLLVNAGRDAIAPALMRTALLRAHNMERLGTPALGAAHADNLFITGAFSVLDVLLGTKMNVLLEHLKLPDEIRLALLGEGGAIAPYLQLAIACEQENTEVLRSMLNALQLSTEDCNSAQIEALAFAGKIQFE